MKLPSYTVLLRLGRSVDRTVTKHHSLAEIARRLGGTRQAVYNESLIALGKVVWLLRRQAPKDQ